MNPKGRPFSGLLPSSRRDPAVMPPLPLHACLATRDDGEGEVAPGRRKAGGQVTGLKRHHFSHRAQQRNLPPPNHNQSRASCRLACIDPNTIENNEIRHDATNH